MNAGERCKQKSSQRLAARLLAGGAAINSTRQTASYKQHSNQVSAALAGCKDMCEAHANQPKSLQQIDGSHCHLFATLLEHELLAEAAALLALCPANTDNTSLIRLHVMVHIGKLKQ